MVVTLRQPLTLEECQQIRIWRNDPAVMPILRTGYKSEADQVAFYREVISYPNADHWYYAVEADGQFVGVAGLTYLARVPGEAEISLVLGPEARWQGIGTAAVTAILAEAKGRGLTAVRGECYATGNLGFWTAMIRKRPALMQWKWTLL